MGEREWKSRSSLGPPRSQLESQNGIACAPLEPLCGDARAEREKAWELGGKGESKFGGGERDEGLGYLMTAPQPMTTWTSAAVVAPRSQEAGQSVSCVGLLGSSR